jgi:hypothetical protein
MADMIAFCGLDCAQCKGYIATKKADPGMKKALAAEWSRQYGHPFDPEKINCLGCTPADGPHLGYCEICEIRKCAVQKKVTTCASCAGYRCEPLTQFHGKAKGAKARLDRLRKKAAPKKR